MEALLYNLTFLYPWVLGGLLLLPALWFLLQVTPPGPKRLVFPATRLLEGLIPESTTSSRTPLLILLLRMLILALIIIALARPVLNANDALEGQGPIRIVMDNGWESAQTWSIQTNKAEALIEQASRDRRPIYILTTAPIEGENKPMQWGPLARGEAEAILGGLTPEAWPADYRGASNTAQNETISRDAPLSFWLSTGLGGPRLEPLARTLQKQGGVRVFKPLTHEAPLLLKPEGFAQGIPTVQVQAVSALERALPVTVEARNKRAEILATEALTLDSGETAKSVSFELPATMKRQISQIKITGRQGAGAVMVLDNQLQNRKVGIVVPPGKEETAPLIEQSYYVDRALEPYTSVETGTILGLLENKPGVMVLTDIGNMPPEELDALENWIKKGGLLLRFAGPTMAEGTTFLTPVPLRHGGRALDGTLTWDQPVQFADFPEDSPLYGLPVSKDVTVSRQLLAEPIEGLKERTWATLADGTPIITASPVDKGLIVLIHTTATPEWSNLALSGMFVEMLRRIITLTSFEQTAGQQNTLFYPEIVLNGWGSLTKPGNHVRPIQAVDFDKTKPSPRTPPGLYSSNAQKRALNIDATIEKIDYIGNLPNGITLENYEDSQERNLMPPLLFAAFALFLLDWLVMILLQIGIHTFHINMSRFRKNAACWLLTAMMAFSLAPQTVYAQTQTGAAKQGNAVTAMHIDHASEIHLAFIRSGDPSVDQTAERGLTALSQILSRRTSVEPGDVVQLDPEVDELAFFPIIYWPVTRNAPPLSSEALRKIQYYLDHGGTILFDTRDRISEAVGVRAGGQNAGTLQELVSGLNIPPLTPMPDNHVLTKSFYLLQTFPGRYEGGTLWIEEKSANGRDGVSSVIIGSHDWAYLWADINAAQVHGGQTRKQELSYRFGVNLVMYALTGNYKADQVHVPHILERLGQ